MSDRPKPSRAGGGDYEIGYGKPPAEHRFRKGQTGNPRGRPKAASNRHVTTSMDVGTQPANAMLLEEAYRPVTVREGEQVIRLPAIQAVWRAMGMAAIKGNRFAQRTLAELVQQVEEEDRKARCEAFEVAVQYKTEWEARIEHAQARGEPEPQPLPHPDDIIFNLSDGSFKIAGPKTPEETREWDKLLARRDEAQSEVSYYAERHRRVRSAQKKAHYIEHWHAEQKIFDIINDMLPYRYRRELDDRSWREGASRAGAFAKSRGVK